MLFKLKKFFCLIVIVGIAVHFFPFGTNISEVSAASVSETIDISSYLNKDLFRTPSETEPNSEWLGVANRGINLEEFEQLDTFVANDSNDTLISGQLVTPSSTYNMYNLYEPAGTPTTIFIDSSTEIALNTNYSRIYFIGFMKDNADETEYSIDVLYNGEEYTSIPVVNSNGENKIASSNSDRANGQKNIFSDANTESVGRVWANGSLRDGGSCVYEYYIDVDAEKTIEKIKFNSVGSGIYIFSLTGNAEITIGNILCEDINSNSIDLEVNAENSGNGFVYSADFGNDNFYYIDKIIFSQYTQTAELLGKKIYASEDGYNYDIVCTVSSADESVFEVNSDKKYRYVKIEDCQTPALQEVKIVVSDTLDKEAAFKITGDEKTQNGEYIVFSGKTNFLKPVLIEGTDIAGKTLYGSSNGTDYEEIITIVSDSQEIDTTNHYNYFKIEAASPVSIKALYNNGDFAVIENLEIVDKDYCGLPIEIAYDVVPYYATTTVEWYYNNEKIENANGASYIPENEGAYYAVVASLYGKQYQTAEVTITEDSLPTAVVNVSGALVEGEILTGTYTYSDSDGHEEDTQKAEFKWYRDGEIIEDATSLSYRLTKDDVGKVISFGVVPYSKNPFAKGEETLYTFDQLVRKTPYIKYSGFAYGTDCETFKSAANYFDGDISTGQCSTQWVSGSYLYVYYPNKKISLNKIRFCGPHSTGDGHLGILNSNTVEVYGTDNLEETGDLLFTLPKNLFTDAKEWKEFEINNYNEYSYIVLKKLSVTQHPAPFSEIEFYEREKGIPQVSDVKLLGSVKAGNELNLDYEFYDSNGLSDISEIKWFKSVDAVNWTEMYENSGNKNYTVVGDEGDFIKVSVTPKVDGSSIPGKNSTGKTVESNVATVPTAPTVKDGSCLSLDNDKEIKNVEVGDVVTLKYEYFDVNMGEDESGTEILWKAADGAVISTSKTYKIEPTDVDKGLVTVTLKVKNTSEKGNDAETKTFTFLPPQTPIVSDVNIVLSGNTISLTYKFSDGNGNLDINTEKKWYVGGSYAGEGSSYIIKNTDYGKTIYATVTPCTDCEPQKGKTVISNTLNIPTGSVQINSPSGSSGGGGGSFMSKNENPLTTPQEVKQMFSDTASHWAKNEINQLASKGILRGDGEKFRPENNITRAEIIAVIVRALGLDENRAYVEGTFSDVSENDWFSGAVQSAYDERIVKGAYGLYNPLNAVTRQELSSMIASAYRYKINKSLSNSSDISIFADYGEIASWASEDIAILYNLGIVKGVDNNCFVPNGNATRAQAAVMISRLLEIIEN